MATRHGITAPGLLFSAGAGVFLTIGTLGWTALVPAVITHPAALIALPGAIPLGTALGAVAAYTTRRHLAPHTDTRTRYIAAIATAIAGMAGLLLFGIIAGDLTDTASRGIGTLVLGGGLTSAALYCGWRARTHPRRARQ